MDNTITITPSGIAIGSPLVAGTQLSVTATDMEVAEDAALFLIVTSRFPDLLIASCPLSETTTEGEYAGTLYTATKQMSLFLANARADEARPASIELVDTAHGASLARTTVPIYNSSLIPQPCKWPSASPLYVPGRAATVLVGTTATLPPGSSATVENAGTSSDAILNFGIPQGAKGDAATISVGGTQTLQPGSDATVTNSGTAAAAVFNFGIPRGDKGDAATVAVGTTTTLAPGSSATVTNSGTASSAVLNFGIPKGDKGDPGTSIQLPVSVANGGTGATTAAAARANLGAVDKAGDTMAGGLTVPDLTVGSRISGPAVGLNSVAAGLNVVASGGHSHAEGLSTTASGDISHAEGSGSSASGVASHAEGVSTTASGYYSHAEGDGTTASGVASHAEGEAATASGYYSHAEGVSTTTQNEAEHAQGFYNASHTGSTAEEQTIHSIGVGSSNDARANAVEVMRDGKVFVKGVGGYDGTNPSASTDIAAIVGGKADAASLRYAFASPTPTISGTGATVVCEDRAINDFTVATGITSLTITPPAAVTGRARDFFCRVTLTDSSLPTVTLTGGTIDIGSTEVAGMTQGVNLLMFTEISSGHWLASRRSAS